MNLDDARTTPPRPAEITPTLSPGPLIVTHAYFRGPLPPPALLEQYERAQPGAADRILTLAEDQQCVRHRMEERTLGAAIGSEARGQWLAFAVIIVGMGTGSWLTVTGHSTIGLISILTPLGAVATAFLHSRTTRERERQLKRYELEHARISQPV